MNTATILNAAADLIEDHLAGEDLRDMTGDLSATAAIVKVAPDQIAALDAIKAFSRFLRRDGIGSERTIGTAPAQVVAALRAASAEASA